MPGGPYTIVASAARTTSSNSDALDADGEYLNLLVDVTAASGISPTLDLTVQWSNNGTDFGGADTADTLVQITAAKKTVKQFAVKAVHYRLVWTIAGTTPSFTFSASAYTTP